jgi:hypothetical protein
MSAKTVNDDADVDLSAKNVNDTDLSGKSVNDEDEVMESPSKSESENDDDMEPSGKSVSENDEDEHMQSLTQPELTLSETVLGASSQGSYSFDEASATAVDLQTMAASGGALAEIISSKKRVATSFDDAKETDESEISLSFFDENVHCGENKEDIILETRLELLRDLMTNAEKMSQEKIRVREKVLGFNYNQMQMKFKSRLKSENESVQCYVPKTLVYSMAAKFGANGKVVYQETNRLTLSVCVCFCVFILVIEMCSTLSVKVESRNVIQKLLHIVSKCPRCHIYLNP